MGSWSPVAGTFLAPGPVLVLALVLGVSLAACAPAERPEPAEEWSPRIDLETERDGGAALPEVGSPLAPLATERRSFAPISASPSGLPPRTMPAAPRRALLADPPAAPLPPFGDPAPHFGDRPLATWPMPMEPTPPGAAPALHPLLLLRPPVGPLGALPPLLPPTVLVPVVVAPAVAPADPVRPAGAEPERQVVRASIREMAFAPARLEITAGTTVIWTNRDPVAHTVTARDRSWDSGLLEPGESWRRTFTTPGTYHFFCLPHPEMTGTVVVKPRG